MIRSRLQFGVTFTGSRFRFVFDTSSTPSWATAGWPCTGVPDRAMPLREWHSSKAQPSVVPGSAPGPSISDGRGFSVSSPQLWNLLPADIRLLHNEHQLFQRRLKTHNMQQSPYATIRHYKPLRIDVNSVISTTTTKCGWTLVQRFQIWYTFRFFDVPDLNVLRWPFQINISV